MATVTSIGPEPEPEAMEAAMEAAPADDELPEPELDLTVLVERLDAPVPTIRPTTPAA
jgi:hypothetical protein